MSDPQTIKQQVNEAKARLMKEISDCVASVRADSSAPVGDCSAFIDRLITVALRARPVEPSAPAQEPIHCYAHASGSCVALKKLAALRQSSPAQEIATWQPIETNTEPDTPVLLWTPRSRLTDLPRHIAPEVTDEIRSAAPRHWTWATKWMPLPAPPTGGSE